MLPKANVQFNHEIDDLDDSSSTGSVETWSGPGSSTDEDVDHENNPLTPTLRKKQEEAEKEEEKKHTWGYWIAYYWGKFFAVAYGALCGLGTASAINSLFESPGMGFAGSEFVAYAFGAVTFGVNVVLFWTVVPMMLVKLFSSKHSVYDESFEVTVNGQKRVINLKNENEQTILVERFTARWWLITFFTVAFALAAALTYTGLLMSKLADTTTWMGIGASGPGFLAIAIPFFIVSLVCNWAFNKFDASQQISHHDFFKNLKEGIRKLFLMRRDNSLMLESEIENPPSLRTMAFRQGFRLALFGVIAYLGYFAIYSVAHMGSAGLFGFLGIPIVAAAKWSLIGLSAVAATYYYTNSTFRFSTFATHQFTLLFQHYRSVGLDSNSYIKLPTPLYWAAQLTVVVPALAVLTAGFVELLKIEWHYLRNTYRQEKPVSDDASYTTRLTHDMESCWEALEIHPNDDVPQLLWNYVARPVITGVISAGLFLGKNVFAIRHWVMHGLAFINAAGNGAFANPALQVSETNNDPNPVSGDALLATVGGFQASLQCYVNTLAQNKEQDKNIDTAKIKSAYPLNMLRFTQSPTDEASKNDNLPYLSPEVETDLKRRSLIG